jgi:hypothetical protein
MSAAFDDSSDDDEYWGSESSDQTGEGVRAERSGLEVRRRRFFSK